MNPSVYAKQLSLSRVALLVFMIHVMGQCAYAQLATYYKFIEGGEVYASLPNQSTTLWSGGSVDDQVSGAITIPTFYFNDVPYTQVYISANGYITFGTAPAANNYGPISSAATYQAVISAFGTDLQSRIQPGNSGTRDVRYQTVGDEFVIEWRHMRRKGLTEWFSFQIRLNTDTREIKIIYGEIGQGPAAATTFQPQVGLRGATNAFPADVLNRMVNIGSEDWGWSMAGTTNASTMRFTSAAPAKSFYNGLSYTWKPAVLYSTSSGNMNDPIWAFTSTGPATGAIVDEHVKVVIQAGHTISVSGITLVGDVELQADAILALGTEQRLAVQGSEVLLNGTVQGNGELSLEGMESTTISTPGSITLGDLIVSTANGTTITGTFDLIQSLRLEAGVLDATTANIRLMSDADGTARLGTVAAGADYMGELTLERYIPAGVTNWRLLGSPVEGRTVGDWNDDFFTAGFPGSNYPNFYVGGVLWPSIRWYDESIGGADPIDGLMGVTGTSQPLEIARGYAVWSGDALGGTQAFKIDVKSSPVIAHSPLELPLTWTDSGNPAADGLNLVSNPLPSPIAFSLLSRGADVENAYWIYNPTNGNNASWNGTVGTNGANGVIQSSQGFWMKANGPAVTTTIDENAKVADNDGGLFGGPVMQNDALPLMRLKVHSNMNQFSDEVVVVFTMGEPGLDAGDVQKFVWGHPQAPQIATRSSDGNDLSINMFGEFSAAISIPVLIDVPVNGTYTISATELEGVDGYSCLVLEDLVTGVITPLHTDAAYSFNMLATDDASVPRFMLHASEPVQHNITDVLCHGASTGQTEVITPTGTTADVVWMNAMGDVLSTHEAVSGSVVFEDIAAGNYMVSVSSDAGCGALVRPITIAQPFALETGLAIVDVTCPGAADGMITATVLGGVAPYELQWSNGGTEPMVTVSEGTYGLLVIDSHGCEMSAEDIVVNSGVTPMAGFAATSDLIHANEPVVFVNTSVDATIYVWEFGDGNISTEFEPTHVYDLPGTYTVTLTVWNGECSDIQTIQVEIQLSTGIHAAHAANTHVWSDTENIVIDNVRDHGPLDISVIDAAGRIHLRKQVQSAQGRILLPAAALPSGIWMVELMHGDERTIFRVPLMR